MFEKEKLLVLGFFCEILGCYCSCSVSLPDSLPLETVMSGLNEEVGESSNDAYLVHTNAMSNMGSRMHS